MRIIKKVKQMQKIAEDLRKREKIIGFVPTMGALHEGHLKLIRETRKRSDILVVSIFVNPIQFGKGEDFKEYPRDIKGDLEKCRKEKVDIVFCPSVREMYPEPFYTYVDIEKLKDHLCGKYRKNHFRGVLTVVLKLFNIVKPHISAFGWKDAQQLIIIGQMIRDLNLNIKLLKVETVRQRDGLAMSSRNVYLSEEERKSAGVLYKALKYGKELIKKGERNPENVVKNIKDFILRNSKDAKIQYIEIVDLKELQPVKKIKGKVMIALAVYFGRARLIDNIRIKVD
jgi:pantoate--beta-alanine ligase